MLPPCWHRGGPGLVPGSRGWAMGLSCQWPRLVTQKAVKDAVRRASSGCK